MWNPKLTVKCPVCPALLGRRDKGIAAEFECAECGWIYPFDKDGIVGQAYRKKVMKTCNCGTCKGKREE